MLLWPWNDRGHWNWCQQIKLNKHYNHYYTVFNTDDINSFLENHSIKICHQAWTTSSYRHTPTHLWMVYQTTGACDAHSDGQDSAGQRGYPPSHPDAGQQQHPVKGQAVGEACPLNGCGTGPLRLLDLHPSRHSSLKHPACSPMAIIHFWSSSHVAIWSSMSPNQCHAACYVSLATEWQSKQWRNCNAGSIIITLLELGWKNKRSCITIHEKITLVNDAKKVHTFCVCVC